jgi:hypothetical protein
VIVEGVAGIYQGETAKDSPMNTLRPLLVLVLSTLCASALGGCAASAPEEASAPAQARELNRADAIASARQDASRSYGDGWGTQANAQLSGGYWLVELHAASGYWLRYAISARDGSIRERSMVQ